MGDLPSFEGPDSTSPWVRAPSATTLLAGSGVVVLVASFFYHYLLLAPDAAVLGHRLQRLDWLWLAGLWLLVAYVGGPTLRDPDPAVGFVRFLGGRPLTLVATGVVALVFLAGTVGTVVLPEPVPYFDERYRPPLFVSISAGLTPTCGQLVNGRCWGTLEHPLGTLTTGRDILYMLIVGSRSLVQLSTVGVLLIVPVGVAVGTAGAYADGFPERVLTGLIEAVKAVPPLLIYLVWRLATGSDTVFMLVLSFGQVGWGSVAALVHSRATSELSKGYVRSAAANGAGPLQIIRWHLLPNVGRTALGAAMLQVPLFIVYEATLTFVEYKGTPLLVTELSRVSWGHMIGYDMGRFDPYWWPQTIPLVVLVLTVISVYVFADALQDYIDPRLEVE